MLNILIAVFASICFYLIKQHKTKPIIKWIWLFYSLLFVVAVYKFGSVFLLRIKTPEIWDFTAFYLYGKVAATHLNIYLPESFHSIFNSISLPFKTYDGFIEEVVNVGFPYPPPTIFYFLPLGLLSYENALLCWTTFNLLFVFGCIYLSYTSFLISDKLNGLILVSTLFLISAQARSTLSFSQTNFILFFFLLLLRKYSNTGYSGIFLSLALFTKPYFLIFGIYFILKRNWRAILLFIISSLFLLGISFIFLGKESFFSYFYNNSALRLPTWVFTESINQSLHSVLLRANIISIDKPHVYLIVALIILSITMIFVYYLEKKRAPHDFIWSILLLIGLLVYPGTLAYYGVVLFFIVFQYFNQGQATQLTYYYTIILIGIYSYLSIISIFTTICFLLLVTITCSLTYVKKNGVSFNNQC